MEHLFSLSWIITMVTGRSFLPPVSLTFGPSHTHRRLFPGYWDFPKLAVWTTCDHHKGGKDVHIVTCIIKEP